MKKNSLSFFNLYFLFSVIYYLIGRYKWNIPSYPKLFAFLALCFLMLNWGYRFSWIGNGKLRYSLYREGSLSKPVYRNARLLFWVSAISLIIFQVVWVVVFFDHFSITNVMSLLGTNYYSRLNTTFDSKIPIMQFRTLLWGITLFVYPIGFLYFKDLPKIDRALLYLTIFIDVFASLNMGVSKNIGDLVSVFIGILLLKNSSNITDTASKQKRKNVLKAVCIVIAFLILFGIIQRVRDVSTTGNVVNPYGQFAERRNNTVFSFVFGEQVSGVIDRIGVYLSHAYTGLAYALELPFENTFLLGFSRALMEYAEQYFGINLFDSTYNARIETTFGWHNGQWWPTAFVWIGNAISLWLVPVFMFVFGVFVRHLEDDYSKSGNLITASLYVQMVITLFYLPCNMQIFQSRASFMGSMLLLVMFFLRNRIFRKLDGDYER